MFCKTIGMFFLFLLVAPVAAQETDPNDSNSSIVRCHETFKPFCGIWTLYDQGNMEEPDYHISESELFVIYSPGNANQVRIKALGTLAESWGESTKIPKPIVVGSNIQCLATYIKLTSQVHPTNDTRTRQAIPCISSDFSRAYGRATET